MAGACLTALRPEGRETFLVSFALLKLVEVRIEKHGPSISDISVRSLGNFGPLLAAGRGPILAIGGEHGECKTSSAPRLPSFV